MCMYNVQKLTTKILKAVPLTKNKTKMSDDKMLFDAPVSSKTFTFKSVLLQTEALNGILSSDIFVLFLVKGTAFKIFVVSFQTPCIHTHNLLISKNEIKIHSKYKEKQHPITIWQSW
jgi:hypothetical protein